jgi:hypothetical protein
VEDPAGWLPEIPVPRFHGAVDVVDRSTADRADLAFTYQSPKHEKMEVTYAGKMPTKPSKPRNGNTMGHSRASLSALLDIHLMRSGGDAHLRINGVESTMKKLLGLYPMTFILGQTQGGLAIADYFQSLAGTAPTDPSGLASFGLRRPAELDPSNPWPTHGQESWTVENGWARRDGPVVSLSYHFTNGELDRAQAWQKGLDFPVTDIAFSPALPDVRRPFDGVVVSTFAVDIAGQEGHGKGEIRSRWVDADTVELQVRPIEPQWFADRPLDVKIRHDADGVRVRAYRVEPE